MNNFKFTTPQESIGLQFWRLHQTWQKKIASALSPFKITHTQFVILASIQWYQSQQLKPSQADLSALTGIGKMTLSKAVIKLEALGFIKKNKSKQDTRAVNIALTNDALVLIPKLIATVELIDTQVFDLKEESDKVCFQRSLVSLNNKI